MSENAENTKKPIYKKWWFWLIIVIIIIGLGGSSNNTSTTTTPTSSQPTTQGTVSSSTETQPQSTIQETIKYTKVDVDELDDALEKNPAAAKDKYNGKYLEIEGRLGTIDSDLSYISLLSATDEWDFLGIHCSLKNKEQKEIVKKLSKDDIITVKGKITSVGEVLGYYLDITEIAK